MRKFLLACSFGAVAAFGLFSCGQHFFENEESRMIEALQQALVLGSKKAASDLGDASCAASSQAAMKCTTGYLGNKLVEIVVPDTVKQVLSFINEINTLPSEAKTILSPLLGISSNTLSSLGKYGDSIKVALNRGAEQAAPGSIDVFKDAIFGMSFSDARETLLGDSVAATTYLHTTTYNGLQSTFAPILRVPLESLNPNKFWTPIASHYNFFAGTYSNIKSNLNSNSNYYLLSAALGNSALPSLPYNALPEDISTYLAEYATGKALDGLFLMVGRQETQLRADPWGTVKALGGFISDGVGELLGDIFSKAKNNSL